MHKAPVDNMGPSHSALQCFQTGLYLGQHTAADRAVLDEFIYFFPAQPRYLCCFALLIGVYPVCITHHHQFFGLHCRCHLPRRSIGVHIQFAARTIMRDRGHYRYRARLTQNLEQMGVYIGDLAHIADVQLPAFRPIKMLSLREQYTTAQRVHSRRPNAQLLDRLHDLLIDLVHQDMLCYRQCPLIRVPMPIYELATRDDHIAPAVSVFTGAQLYGGPVRYVLSGSGHIAGVINPPKANKYMHWVPGGDDFKAWPTLDQWLESAKEVAGSWWPDYAGWLGALSGEQMPARQPGVGPYEAIEDAPGSYVRK